MPHLAHQPSPLQFLRSPTVAEPWRVLVSGCLAGEPVGVDGTSYGMSLDGAPWMRSPRVEVIPFCPEDHGMGTPRPMPDLHDGDGFDVLDGRATMRDPDGGDLTAAILSGADAMVNKAREARVDFAMLTDRSGACGTQCVSVGCRFVEPVRYRRGVGVAAAALLRAGVWVVSQRDWRTLELLRAAVEDDDAQPGPPDHHLHPWMLDNLPQPAWMAMLRDLVRSRVPVPDAVLEGVLANAPRETMPEAVGALFTDEPAQHDLQQRILAWIDGRR